jgi:hypothetical protein
LMIVGRVASQQVREWGDAFWQEEGRGFEARIVSVS